MTRSATQLSSLRSSCAPSLANAAACFGRHLLVRKRDWHARRVAPRGVSAGDSAGEALSVDEQKARRELLRAPFSIDNSSILVAGGGGTALEITKRLKNAGAWVWQLQRTDKRRKEIENMMAIVVNGDACNPEDVERAFVAIDGADAVVTTIGGTPSDPSADSLGNINLIEAAIRHGVKKFVLVTSIGTGNSKHAPPQHVYEALKPVLMEKEKAEIRLMELGNKIDFVIVRPGGLTDESATGTAALTEDTTVCGSITREDLADLVVKLLTSDNANGKVLSAVDSISVAGGSITTFKC